MSSSEKPWLRSVISAVIVIAERCSCSSCLRTIGSRTWCSSSTSLSPRITCAGSRQVVHRHRVQPSLGGQLAVDPDRARGGAARRRCRQPAPTRSSPQLRQSPAWTPRLLSCRNARSSRRMTPACPQDHANRTSYPDRPGQAVKLPSTRSSASRQAGAGPVESRTTSWVGSTRVGPLGLPVRQLLHQHLDGAGAGVLGALGERGQGRVAEVGAEDVVEADDADVVGDAARARRAGASRRWRACRCGRRPRWRPAPTAASAAAGPPPSVGM